MTYNFKQIREMLRFERPGDFYFIQIYKRRKDNPGMENDMIVIRDYYLYSINDLDRLQDEIISMCEYHNARAYIRLNRRNADKTALMMMKRLADLIVDGNTKAARGLYASVSGEFHSEPDKTWVVDLDGEQDDKYIKAVIEEIWSITEQEGRFVAEIPTPNGKHLITTPFNLQKFHASCPGIDVHKDNPTILYVP